MTRLHRAAGGVPARPGPRRRGLVEATRALTEAVKAGDLERAQAALSSGTARLWRRWRRWRRGSATSPRPSTARPTISAAGAGSGFQGLASIEYGLFERRRAPRAGAGRGALLADVGALQARLARLQPAPELPRRRLRPAGGPGRRRRVRTADPTPHGPRRVLAAEIEAARKVVALLRAAVDQGQPELVTEVGGQRLGGGSATLAGYRGPTGRYVLRHASTQADAGHDSRSRSRPSPMRWPEINPALGLG